jgi:hypothetical protein
MFYRLNDELDRLLFVGMCFENACDALVYASFES